ncbi:hypothetical protein KKF55_01125 [Patescibacteria group bacterium]|nr:hypothetical protein [Patescibacteria group bacterium]
MHYRTIPVLLLLNLLLLTGCVNGQQPTSNSGTPSSAPILGGDRDANGCIPSAGYNWCEAKQKCVRPWEESCDSNETDTSSWQNYRNDTLGFSLKFPPSWDGFTVHEGEYPTYRYVNFSFSDTHQPFEIFKIVQYAKDEWETVGKKIPFVVLNSAIDPPLVCDGCCTADGETSGGGQFDIFQQERCKEVPEILSTFESTRE